MMFALLVAGFFVVLLGAFLAGRAQSSSLARRMRDVVLPYLRRRAAESGIELSPASGLSAEAAVDEACRLAGALSDRDAAREIAFGSTLQVPRQPP